MQTILVVEDDTRVVVFLEDDLRSFGYDVVVARNGIEGLHEAKRSRPDLIVMDVMMPLMDGYELCQTLRADPDTWSIPVLMLTAKGQKTDIVKGLETGADDYLPKPYDKLELEARVRTLLRRLGKRRTGADVQEYIDHEGLSLLYDLMIDSFDEQELATLAFKLGIEFDALPGSGKNAKAREMILFLKRRTRLSDLIQLCARERPKRRWTGP